MIQKLGCSRLKRRLNGSTIVPPVVKVVVLVVLSLLLLRTALETIAPAIYFPSDRWPTADRKYISMSMYNYYSKPPFYTKDCAGCRGNVSVSDLKSAHRSVYSRTGISCKALFQGDRLEQGRAKQYMNDNEPDINTPEQILRMTKDCNTFRRMRGYASVPMSKEEAEFPLAFSVLIKGDADQAERLLRAIYAPQNYYCLHVDLKTSPLILSAMRGVASCFDNVFLARRLESVYWGHVSIMYAEMNCLEDLLGFSWKYFINLSGQMFPGHSNRDLVQILRLYDGANDVEGTARRFDTLPFIERLPMLLYCLFKSLIAEIQWTSGRRSVPINTCCNSNLCSDSAMDETMSWCIHNYYCIGLMEVRFMYVTVNIGSILLRIIVKVKGTQKRYSSIW